MASKTAAGKSKAAKGANTSDADDAAAMRKHYEAQELGRSRVGVLDVLRLVGGLFLLSSALSYFVTNDSILWGYRPPWTRSAVLKSKLTGPLELTDAELSKFDGTNPDLPIYLAIEGVIYDVSASPHFYGPGSGYHVFAGRDATRSFVTGCFDEDKTPDMRGVEEMYVPKELDHPPMLAEDATEAERKESRRMWKLKREEWRSRGRARARATVDGWVKTFDGGQNGKYFKVGTVKRQPGWEKKLGPKRKLCQRADDNRPEKIPEE